MAWVAWPGAAGAAQACQASLSPAVQQVGPCKTWLSVQLSVSGMGREGTDIQGPGSISCHPAQLCRGERSWLGTLTLSFLYQKLCPEIPLCCPWTSS